MVDKKYTKDDIINAILLKFGSIEKYADYKKTSRQNIYSKIERRASKFIVELMRDGVLSSGKSFRFGDVIENSNVNKGDNNIIGESYYKEKIKDLERIIKSLEDQIELLKK